MANYQGKLIGKNERETPGPPPISADTTTQDSIIALEALLNFRRGALSTSKAAPPPVQNANELIFTELFPRGDGGSTPRGAENTNTQNSTDRPIGSTSPVLSQVKKTAVSPMSEMNLSQPPHAFIATSSEAALPSLMSSTPHHALKSEAKVVQPCSKSILGRPVTSLKSSNSIAHPLSLTLAEGRREPSNTAEALSSSSADTQISVPRRSDSISTSETSRKSEYSLSVGPTLKAFSGNSSQPEKYNSAPSTPSMMATKAVFSSSPGTLFSLNSEAKPSPSTPNSINSIASPISEQTAHLGETVTTTAAMIRIEEVEAALKSKPQRGRKRENLSALERLELTRTRNREHAKSTRIRKKARHEELVNREQKFFELKRRDDLDTARRESILNFMILRSAILRLDHCAGANHSKRTRPCFVAGHGINGRSLSTASEESSPSSDGSDVTVRASGSGIAPRNVEKKISENETNDSLESKLAEFIEDVNRIKVTPFLTDKRLPSNHGIQGIGALRILDRKLVSIVTDRFNLETVPALQFRIVNSHNGIAMTTGNDAYAEYDAIVVEAPRTEQPEAAVLKGMMKIQFTPNSHKIQSVGISSMSVCDISADRNTHPCPVTKKCDDGVEGALTKAQFPSVVSLENSASIENFGGLDEKVGEQSNEGLPINRTVQQHEDEQDHSSQGIYI